MPSWGQKHDRPRDLHPQIAQCWTQHVGPRMLTTRHLPSFHKLWQEIATRADTEGWPAARFLAVLPDCELPEYELPECELPECEQVGRDMRRLPRAT